MRKLNLFTICFLFYAIIGNLIRTIIAIIESSFYSSELAVVNGLFGLTFVLSLIGILATKKWGIFLFFASQIAYISIAYFGSGPQGAISLAIRTVGMTIMLSFVLLLQKNCVSGWQAIFGASHNHKNPSAPIESKNTNGPITTDLQESQGSIDASQV